MLRDFTLKHLLKNSAVGTSVYTSAVVCRKKTCNFISSNVKEPHDSAKEGPDRAWEILVRVVFIVWDCDSVAMMK